jgi:hypothetical protein
VFLAINGGYTRVPLTSEEPHNIRAAPETKVIRSMETAPEMREPVILELLLY